MLKFSRHARFALCAFGVVGMMALAGCEDTPDTPFPLVGGSSSVPSSPPPGGACDALTFKSYDEAIDGGHYTFAYGTIEKTEPVLDLYDWNPETKEGQTSCDGDVDPALRIHVRLSDATWDKADEQVITVGIRANAWVNKQASPQVSKSSQSISWSDGHKYFRSGDEIGMLGAFNEHGDFIVGATNFFTVDSAGKIANFRRSKCLAGELNGMSFDDVIARSHEATEGQKIYLTPTPTAPLSSACTK